MILHIIPVIDLLNGFVVHAKRGQRSQYLPIQSSLTCSCQPLDIAGALLKLYPFKTLYIADIDAIQQIGSNQQAIAQIAEAFPDVNIWFDSGLRQMSAHRSYSDSNIKPVLGSENIVNLQTYRAMSYACKSQHILSLDYTVGPDLITIAMGIAELHQSVQFWPENIICMTLNAVGNEQGVDLDKLNEIIHLNLARKIPSNIYAAGGVRNVEDLVMLKSIGAHGALVATSLHNKQLSADEIKGLAQ